MIGICVCVCVRKYMHVLQTKTPVVSALMYNYHFSSNIVQYHQTLLVFGHNMEMPDEDAFFYLLLMENCKYN